MDLTNLTIAFPSGPYFSDISYLIYTLLRKRFGTIGKSFFGFPFIEREYIVFNVIGRKTLVDNISLDLINYPLTEDEINIKEINAEIKGEHNNPLNYINDLFYSTFFPSPYSNAMYKEIKKPNISLIKKHLKKSMNNVYIVKKEINTKSISTIGNFKKIKEDIKIKNKGIKDFQSSFPSAFIQLGNLYCSGKNNLINAHLLSAYYFLFLRRELCYKGKIAYRLESDVYPHYFGYLVKIYAGGISKTDRRIIDKLFELLDQNPDIPLEYIKNRAIAKIYMDMEIEFLWGREYITSNISGYSIDELIKGIKDAKSMIQPKTDEMFGILLK